MKTVNNIVMKLLGVLLLTVAILCWCFFHISWSQIPDVLHANKPQGAISQLDVNYANTLHITAENTQHEAQSEKVTAIDSVTSQPNVKQATDLIMSDPIIDELSADIYKLASLYTERPLTNLTPYEQDRAVDVFLREKNMWEQFNELNGEIELHAFVYDEEKKEDKEVFAIKGLVQIQKTGPDPNAVKNNRMYSLYKISITDPNKTWVFTSDGTTEGTKFLCEDASVTKLLGPWLNKSIPQVISVPKMNLSIGPFHKNNAFDYFNERRSLWKNPSAPDDPEAFMYGLKEINSDYGANMFEKGHFSHHEKVENKKKSYATYGSYMPEDTIRSFPGEITIGYKNLAKLTMYFRKTRLDFVDSED